jgi:hypothetical protein
MTTKKRDELWPRFVLRFSELDDIRTDDSLPIWQRADAEARRDELARTWNLIADESPGD